MDTTMTVDEWTTHMMGGFSIKELNLAFDCVKDMRDWKLPISTKVAASVTAVTRDQISAAIDFMVGGGAEFVDHEDGSYTVTAPGYYAIIGS